MPARRNGTARRVLEMLEARQLPAALLPLRAAEVRHLAQRPALNAPSLFVEPEDGRAAILQAIASARRQIRIGICNLSDPLIGQALTDAVARGVSVRLLIDRADYIAKAPERQEIARLIAGGVQVHLSNPIFQQSFEKYLVVDQRTVLIMTMCLVPETFEDTRDYGLVLARKDIIGEVTRVFENDWTFSAPPGAATPPINPTPPLTVADLLWSPINSRAKLTRLIQSARRSIDATTELLGDPFLESELIAAAQRGVRVRLILPLTPRENFSNQPGIASLASQGVGVRVTIGQFPPPGRLPYMHAKTMIVDGRRAYLGSIDLQSASTSDDRELGVLFQQPRLVAHLAAQFAADWAAARPVP